MWEAGKTPGGSESENERARERQTQEHTHELFATIPGLLLLS